MTLAKTLKCLANGIHPETGCAAPRSSALHKPETIRMFYNLIDELIPSVSVSEQKSDDQPRIHHLPNRKPTNRHMPWSDILFDQLAIEYEKGVSIASLAKSFGRPQLAIAIQLEKLDLVTQEEVDTYRTLAGV